MNWKQHKLLSISTVLFVIFMLAGGGLLFKTRSGYVQQKQELRAKLGELDKLNNRKPFPSPDNQNVLDESLERVQAFYQTMIRAMADGQVEPKRIEPAQFPTLLNGSLHRLRQRAKKEKITHPPGFSFGFTAYADGSLPKSDDLARLTSQLQMVESLVETIFAAGAESILEVKRERFEQEKLKVEAPSRRRSVKPDKSIPKPAEEAKLFKSEKITLSFIGSDQAVWAALNALATHDQFVVVTAMELRNPVKPNVAASPVYRSAEPRRAGGRKMEGAFEDPFALFQPSDVNGGQPWGADLPSDELTAVPEEQMGSPLSHEERIVAGRESVLANITVKIYQFNKDELPVEEEATQEGTSS